MTEAAPTAGQRPQRIVIFSTAYLPMIGGAEVAVHEITRRLPDIEWVLVTARLDQKLPETEQMGSVKVHRVGVGNVWDKFRLIAQGPRLAHTLGPFDGVWAIMASYGGFAALRYKNMHRSTPYFLTLQEGDSRYDIYKHVWWCWPYFKQIFTRATRIQVISQYLKSWAQSMGSTAAIRVVPNGVDTALFNPSAATVDRDTIRATLGIPKDAPTIVTVSRLVKKNNIGRLITALTFLPRSYRLIVVGGGSDEAKLRAQADRIVPGQVHFVGSVQPSEVLPYMHAADVFCRPSVSEGLGNAFLEAMAAGVPVVATRVGGIPDFLIDGETGLYCDPFDPADIARSIATVCDTPALAQMLVQNAARLISASFTWEQIVKQMKEFFAQSLV